MLKYNWEAPKLNYNLFLKIDFTIVSIQLHYIKFWDLDG